MGREQIFLQSFAAGLFEAGSMHDVRIHTRITRKSVGVADKVRIDATGSQGKKYKSPARLCI